MWQSILALPHKVSGSEMSKMSESGDINPAATAGNSGNGGDFGPRQAAALLDQTTQQARRRFQPSPPLLNVFRAVVVLAAFGGIWLSVRRQHPYIGPSGWALAITFALVGIVIGWSAAAMKRADAGVTGPAQRARNIEIAVMLTAWAAVYLFMGALAVAGASDAIVYGLYPATAPFIVVGLVGAANAAGRQDWPMLRSTLPLAVVGVVAAFGGPVNVWLIMGIGLCVVFLGTAGFTFWQQRRSVVGA
jgi:hypothetical protein